MLPVNTKVRVIKATTVLGEKLLVLDGETTCLQTVYLSDKPVANPNEDLEKRLTALEKLVQTIVQFLSGIFKNFKEK